MTTTIHIGDSRAILPTLTANSVHCVITSPPYYGLRAYSDNPAEIGREQTPEQYIAAMVATFCEVRRVLRDDGCCWLNLGDSYASDSKWGGATGGKHAAGLHGNSGISRARRSTGAKDKDLLLIPHRVALALQADGWYLRSTLPWLKRNAMPESVTDRPTTARHVRARRQSRRQIPRRSIPAWPRMAGVPLARRGTRRRAASSASGRAGRMAMKPNCQMI